jgi:hypothetical protein
MIGFRSKMLKLDHFTPLSRAVASIDRDAYAARFAVYDREHKKLLRRLATADTPVSDADIAREEQAFRDAIRRIEFADESEQATLVPQDEPAEAPASEPPLRPELPSRPELPPEPTLRSEVTLPPEAWQQLRSPRREALDAPGLLDDDQVEPASAIAATLRLSPPRSVMRRVGERMVLAVLALVLTGVGLWTAPTLPDREPVSATPAVPSSEPAAVDNAADPKASQPTWLSPQMFYAPPPMPSAPTLSPPASFAPRADVPLPVPRPDR